MAALITKFFPKHVANNFYKKNRGRGRGKPKIDR